jgi:hypothetical protein
LAERITITFNLDFGHHLLLGRQVFTKLRTENSQQIIYNDLNTTKGLDRLCNNMWSLKLLLLKKKLLLLKFILLFNLFFEHAWSKLHVINL